MRIIQPKAIIYGPIDERRILRSIERVARTCYKSEELAGEGTAEKLVSKFLQNDPPHLAMLDHETIRVKFIVDRGITHEIVRHRIGVAYAQESTRYCNYSKGKFDEQITVIEPPGLLEPERHAWVDACSEAERSYLFMVSNGCKPQIARSVLPTCLKAEIVVTANLTAWRHIFTMRCDKAAHPQMLQVMVPLLRRLKSLVPIVFDSIPPGQVPDYVTEAAVEVQDVE